ncbi:MAG: NAD(P)H-dependent oxidoreductase [Pseudomonadota bacterium]
MDNLWYPYTRLNPDAMYRLLAINGCYRENSVIDQAVELAAHSARDAGATTETTLLRELPVSDCLDCWHCIQAAEDMPADCVMKNHMHPLLDRIHAADGFILASPANIYTASSVFMHFMVKLMTYARCHRAAGEHTAAQRQHTRPALLISSSATPGLMGRLYYSTQQQLRETARTLGARPAGCVFVEMIADREHTALPEKAGRQLRYLAGRLLRES